MEKLKIGYFALSQASWKAFKIVDFLEFTICFLNNRFDVQILHLDDLITDKAGAEATINLFKKTGMNLLFRHFVILPAGPSILMMAERIVASVVLMARRRKKLLEQEEKSDSYLRLNFGRPCHAPP